NRRARHEYFILDSYECGIVLVGSEVKSIRDGRANLVDAYARIEDGEVWLYGMHISPYPFSRIGHDPTRRRKLLLHRAEIDRLVGKLSEAGLTMVPLKAYFQNGVAKIELALVRGKRQWDKRQAMAERDAKRETERALRTRNRGGE
ncbi:MAG TPA: SsrA-binding protein SmpB, partial [Acidimicrobiia bacterium]|nr:SsrA-binding protein SmpB [Acidimicrobiia bacterium]